MLNLKQVNGNDLKHPLQKAHFLHIGLIALTASAAFGLGRLSVIESAKEPLSISYFEQGAPGSIQAAAAVKAFDEAKPAMLPSAGQVVASKNGRSYHFPWCPGAQAISPQNKVYFDSAEKARESGYQPAKNCKGLK